MSFCTEANTSELICFSVRGEPTAWARAGRGKGFTFTPRKQRDAMNVLKLEAGKVMAETPPLQGPLFLKIQFTYGWPASTSKKKRADPIAAYRTARPDLDNLVKLIGDSLNTIVWSDDAQIVALTATKCYGDIPGVNVTVGNICGSTVSNGS